LPAVAAESNATETAIIESIANFTRGLSDISVNLDGSACEQIQQVVDSSQGWLKYAGLCACVCVCKCKCVCM
jgi:hypothetical protein